MKITKLISPTVSKLITSQGVLNTSRTVSEMRRKHQNRPHLVTFYYRANDPYSFLLLQLMPQFRNDFDIELKFVVVSGTTDSGSPDDTNPEPELLEQYALKDCRKMAELWQLNFPNIEDMPCETILPTFNQVLTAQINTDDFIQAALQAGQSYWNSDAGALKISSDKFGCLDQVACQALLESNQHLLVKKGHYLSATLHYEGEWYWGLDRIHYLVARLLKLDVNRVAVETNNYSRLTRLAKLSPLLPASSNTQDEHSLAENLQLDFYFSFRSPYSYLAIERTFKLCELYQLPLRIKPVLPMVMRGLAVPRSKRLYILSDAAREASFYQIPFGKIVDPVGKGVERCLAVYEYAVEEGQERPFLLSAARGIWSEGIDVATSKGLRKVVERSGLNWQKAQAYLSKDTWRQRVEENRQEMFAMGLWGVPSFRLDGMSVWGQDRIDYLKHFLDDFYSKQNDSRQI